MATVEFGVPQGSIPGPVIFNLYVADLQKELQSDCYQYADDTTFYVHSKPGDLDSSVAQINETIASLKNYSNCCNLASNATKTNWTLVSTPQMSHYHSFEERDLPIICGGSVLKRISCTKLLGVHINQHLSWDTHVDSLLSSSYGTLSVLRRLNLAPFHIRKHLVESLDLSKLNYACTVFHPLPVYQEKRLQCLQNACAGFVIKTFAGLQGIIKLNWLPVKENVEFNILKLAHKSLYDNNSFPEYLKLTLHQVTAYNLRSSTAPVFSIPRE